MNYIIRAAERIPYSVRLFIMEELFPGALAGNPSAMAHLFAIYNEYIAPEGEKKDYGCDMCRSLIMGRFKTIITNWQQQEAEEQDQ